MMDDSWIEIVRCPQCGRVATRELSLEDDGLYEGQANPIAVPGFKVVSLPQGFRFDCADCGVPAKVEQR